jgi:sulfur relay (sulfurtransferase) DsrC/TusE family protein
LRFRTTFEEAWAVHDPEQRQIFLYDDFLGRTALHDRFAKNEDRRLIDFMAKTGGGSRTLFVLTTREYILRQASQFYERLAQANIAGRRFLLELKDYARLERARILYNHLFFSPSVDDDGLRSLLESDGYLIDHPNYNPRLIEWITGMAGHRLTAQDNERLREFSLETLTQPETLWQHAFEQELDANARAVLFCLVVLPDVVGIDALESAFEALCSVQGRSTAGKAFQNALAALDDSMIRTLHTNRGVQVTPHSPSVVDYVRGYLADSPGAGRRCLTPRRFGSRSRPCGA